MLVGVLALALVGFALTTLEAERAGLVEEPLLVGQTPATVLRPEAADGPVVVIAHGFAGSRQLMQGYAVTLARAGFTTVSYDLLGHGRNPVPMSGDVTAVEGTTRLLVEELRDVISAARAQYPDAPGLALLGHSMATDIIVRASDAGRAGAVVGVSTFSEAITATAPPNLLLLVGQWEPRLIEAARDVLDLRGPGTAFGARQGQFADGSARRAVIVPNAEHVAVLYAPRALEEARGWLQRSFGREVTEGPVSAQGRSIALLLVGLTALAWALTGLLPRNPARVPRLPAGYFVLITAGPALFVPIVLSLFDTRFLPVLVADYLALHLLAYGLMVLVVLAHNRVIAPRHILRAILLGLVVAGYGIGVFGWALDTYVASFWPVPARLTIILVIAAGAIAYMSADAVLSEAGRAPLWRTLFSRAMLLVSLLLAVALDFERLFFLLLIALVILLFLLLFGSIGGAVGRRTGSAAAVGLGNGLILAWALGVSFPLFLS
ncbi:MAG: alpha/beta fold hydrolase [Pseudomonadota bacterium]